jgi:hypothetical protein
MGAAQSAAVAAAMPHAEFLQAAQGKPVANPSSIIGRWMSTPAQAKPQQPQTPQQQFQSPGATTTNTANVVKALGL